MTIPNVIRTVDRTSDISPPEPDLTPGDLIRRAVELRPLLRQAQAAVEADGDLSEEMNRRFIDAGFYRVIQPRVFGGYEFPMPCFVRLMMELARGCMESAWVVSLTAGHTFQLASFPIAGQAEAYGTAGELRSPEVTAPPGEATPVPGGYRIKGTWDYASGCAHATHMLVVAHVIDPLTLARTHAIMAIMDRRHYSIVKNWNVFGMQGTGSNRIVIDDVFVPEHRTKPMYSKDGKRLVPDPDRSVLTNPFYYGPFRPFVLAETTSIVVGGAQGALDCYEELFTSRKLTFPIAAYRYELAEFQFNFGRCQALIGTAQAALIHIAEEYMERAAAAETGGARFDEDTERRMGLVQLQCVHLAWEAMDIMFRTAGTSNARKDSMLGRYWRNMGVIRGHLAHQSDSSALNFGRTHFGIAPVGP